MHMTFASSGPVAGGDGSILTRLVGVQLTQVWFVMDHLQLVFGADHALQCFVWPRIEVGGRTLIITATGYRDALCAFLTSEVTAVAEQPAVGIVIDFTAGRIVLAPTRDELVGPEIAMFSDTPATGGNWQVWAPGDEIFAHLA